MSEGKFICGKIMGTMRRSKHFQIFTVRTSLSAARRRADGKKIDGRRVVVDVERGRTVKDWRPRRLGKLLKKLLKRKLFQFCF